MSATPWGEEPPPIVITRFLYGKATPIEDTSSNVQAQPGQLWRIFTDDEEQRLQQGWNALSEAQRDKAREAHRNLMRTAANKSNPSKSKGDANTQTSEQQNRSSEDERNQEASVLERTIANPDAAPDSLQQHVAIGPDALFTCDLSVLELFPVFWPGPHVPVQNASWFVPRYEGSDRFQPLQDDLAEQLEIAYRRIGSWHSSYAEELASAVSLGAEAEAKLRVELDDIALDVIFQGPDSARVFNRGIASRFSKTLLNSFVRGQTTHSGGQLVLRGWEACLKWKNKTDSKSRPETPSAFRASPNPKSASMPEDTTAKPSDSASNLSLAFSTSWNRWWKSSPKLEGSHSRPASEAGSSLNQEAMTPPRASTDVGEVPQASRSDETTEAIEGSAPQQKGQTNTVNELPEELILCIHGVGQKLADTWESFSFAHAVNELRSHASRHSVDPTFADLAKGRRLQFLPVRWRTQLQLEDLTKPNDDSSPEEHLDNRFSIRDCEPAGMPSLRSVVSDVSMDVPVYMSHHRLRVVQVVMKEANRVYRLFCQRNPKFKGKCSIVAHSLGAPLAIDILSEQPTWVPPLAEQAPELLRSSSQLCFNVRCLFFVGAPLGIFFMLNRAQLIARKGRARTQGAAHDVALDRKRWGCLPVDAVYNVYHVLDPLAQLLGPLCDRDWAREHAQPIAIPAQTSGMLTNIPTSFSKFWEGIAIPRPTRFAVTTTHPEAAEIVDAVDKHEQAEYEASMREVEGHNARQREREEAQAAMDAPPPLSERDQRAADRFKALNPTGILDYYLPDDSTFGSYLNILLSHAGYWTDVRFSAFLVAQLFADDERLSNVGQQAVATVVGERSKV